MTADLHTLTGAYVLHALSESERAAFERHLADCAACATEVRELAATAERLGTAVAVTPPPELRERVMRRITTVRQVPPGVPPVRRGGRGGGSWRLGRALPRLALAACLVAATVGAGAAVWQYQRAEDARQQAREAERAGADLMRLLTAPDLRAAVGELPGGATGTLLLSGEENRAAFVASGMPDPPEGMVYQLWFDDDGAMRPAGLMDPAAGPGATTVLMDGPVDGAQGMGITVEPAGGSPAPTSEPLAEMPFPAAEG